MTVQYAEMVGFLKGMRLAGKDVRCRLSSNYDVIRSEYERHLTLVENTLDDSVIDDIDNDTLPPNTNSCEVPQFNKIDVIDCVDKTHIIVELENEARILEIRWYDGFDCATTVNREVAVVSEDVEQRVDICKLEISIRNGQPYAYPLSKHGGKVQWLHPDEKTKYYRIKADIKIGANNCKCIYVDTEDQHKDMVTAQDFVACRSVYDESLKITRRYPIQPKFIRSNGIWVLHESSNQIDWIYGIQSAIQHKYKIGETVYLQDEYGQATISLWQICKLEYFHLCLMAYIHCVFSSDRHKRHSTTILPIVQLIPVKDIRI